MVGSNLKRSIPLKVTLTVFLFAFAGTALASIPQEATMLADEVRHELIMLPYYGVFDNIEYKIEDQNTVVLTGQVTQPYLKDDAAAALRTIKDVGKVVNNIEVLPVSPYDDSIRLATYRAIFFRPNFEKYAIQATSPIRIIVKNGSVTLDGYVGSQLDKTAAVIAANSVPGVFSVTDNLKIG